MCLALASIHSLNMIPTRVYEAGEPKGPLGHLVHSYFTDEEAETTSSQGIFKAPFSFLVSRFLFICEFCLRSFDELFPFLNAIFPLCGVVPNLAKIKRKKPTKKQQQKKQGAEEYSNQNYFIHRLRERTYGYQEGKARGKG